MTSRSLCLALIAALAVPPATGHGAETNALNGFLLAPKAFRAAAAKVLPSVVVIETYGGATPARPKAKRPTGEGGAPVAQKPGEGPGTGLIISADGHILTSTYHFVREQPVITVVLPDDSQQVARLLARDDRRKLCLLKIEGVRNLPVPEFADPARLQIGQYAVAIGFGYGGDEPTLAAGIVSALNRLAGRAVQTDAKLNPAHYGGPLIDIEGRVIGINVPLSPKTDETLGGTEWYDSGIGFAVPIGDPATMIKLENVLLPADRKSPWSDVRLPFSQEDSRP